MQMLDHLGMAWDLRWKPLLQKEERSDLQPQKKFLDPIIPTKVQVFLLPSFIQYNIQI